MLKGTLDDFALKDVLRLLSRADKTGCLTISKNEATGRVFFRDGDVYYAESSASREGYGRKLVRMSALTERQLGRALDASASTGERLGEVLVGRGLVTASELESALQQETEESVLTLFGWDQGEFSFEVDVDVAEETPPPIPVEALIDSVMRRRDEIDDLKRRIAADAVPTAVWTPREGATEVRLSPREWPVVCSVDGKASVADIVAHNHLAESEALAVLDRLTSAGLVELRRGDGAQAPVIDLAGQGSPASPAAPSALGESS